VNAEKTPRVSVVVPYRNAKAFILNLLESLLNQNYPKNRYEIMLVDDGSTDGSSGMITKAMKQQRETCSVKTLRFKDGGGPARARNLGIKHSKGEIIAFTDADALPDKNWLRELVYGFNNDLVGGVMGRVVTDFGKLLYPTRVSPISKFVTCNIAYRKRALVECGLFDEEFKSPFREDSDIAYRILDHGYDIVQRDSALVYHPIKQLGLKNFIRIPKYHAYDVLLFKKHPMRSKQDAIDIKVYRLTTGGIGVILSLLISLCLLAISPVELSLLIILSYFLLITSLLTIFRPSIKGKPLKDRIVSSIHYELFVLLSVIGHIIGSVKFRKLLV
jgi:glycosyltransferase involved in cell wall biosynthesis